LLARLIKRSRWFEKDSECDDDACAALGDFSLREAIGEDYLSFYAVNDDMEGRRVVAALKITKTQRPDNADYLLFSRLFLEDAGISLVPKPDIYQCDFVSRRHVGTLGPLHEPDLAVIKQIMVDEKTVCIRLRKAEIQELASELRNEIPDLFDRMSVHWRAQIYRANEGTPVPDESQL
jgi:hypothetical protein